MFIPEKEYKKIVESVPIVCVDVVLRYRKQYILVKRADEPLKGHWWIVGGRMHKGETTKEAAIRKVKEELGLTLDPQLQFLGVYEDQYKKSAWGVPTSSVSVVYLGYVDSFDYKHDKSITDVKLSPDLPEELLSKILKR